MGLLASLFRCSDEAIPRAAILALPVSLFAGVLKHLEHHHEGWGDIINFSEEWQIKGAVFTTFTSLLAMLIVFRTSQAYSRYWEGVSLMQSITGSFFDAASCLMSYASVSTAKADRINEFRQTLVSLTSLLSATCFAELLAVLPEAESHNIIANQEVMGWSNFDEETRQNVQRDRSRVTLVFFWWQCCAVKAVKDKTITVHPSLVARSFQQVGKGLISFEAALKLSRVPVPISYTKITLWLLMIHSILTPLVMLSWSERPAIVFMFSFMLNFVYWALFLTSEELEDPFGTDESDVDICSLQRNSNDCLRMLLSAGPQRTPRFAEASQGGKADLAKSRASFLCEGRTP